MGLAFKVDSLKGLDEVIAGLYTKEEGGDGYVLEVAGVVDKSRLDEFRSTNIKLMKDKDAAAAELAKFDGVDMDVYKKMAEDAKVAAAKATVKQGDVDKMVSDRVQAMKAEYDTSTQELEAKLSDSKIKLEDLVIDVKIREAASSHKVSPNAVSDVLLRARNIFNVVDGKMVAVINGEPAYGKDGVTPLSVSEWVKDLQKTASHLFVQSVGGGARGGFRSGADVDKMSPTQKIEAGLAAE